MWIFSVLTLGGEIGKHYQEFTNLLSGMSSSNAIGIHLAIINTIRLPHILKKTLSSGGK